VSVQPSVLIERNLIVSEPDNHLVFIGVRGSVIALDRSTGEQVWHTRLKGGGFVNLVLDHRDLLATTKGEVFCLDPATGHIQWNNPLSGMGFGLVTIASSDGSSTATIQAQKLRDEAAEVSAG
jgi:outer membrane protein assembly factor BamB